MVENFPFLPVLNQLEANRDNVRLNRRRGGGGTPLPGLKGYVPLNKLVFKGSSESQKSTISIFKFSVCLFVCLFFLFFYLGVFLDRKQFKQCEGWL